MAVSPVHGRRRRPVLSRGTGSGPGSWDRPSELRVRRRRIAGQRPPAPPDLPQHRRVHDQVPERPDRGHVAGPEQPVGLDEDGHLAAVAAGPVWNPAEVHDPVNGPVDDLRGPLVAGQVQRGEGERVEVRAGWGLAQIRRQPLAKRRPLRAGAGVRAVPAEQLPGLPADRPERADGAGGGGLRRVAARSPPPHQPREVVRAARRRQCPYVLEPEVTRELVDAPGPGGVRGVREPHAGTSIYTVPYKWNVAPPAAPSTPRLI